MPAYPLVSVILLSYNRPALLRKALASVLQQSYPALQTIVVDNHSPATEEIVSLVSQQTDVELICNPTNLGFTGGMNRGLQAARGEYVCLTEDDIVLDKDYVRSLVEYHEILPGLALLSGLQLNEGSGTIRCSGGQVHLNGVYPLRIATDSGPGGADLQEPFATDFVTGSMMFGRRRMFQLLGGFRDEFFMYMEDVELCLRAKRCGLPILLVPQARAWHLDHVGAPPGEELEFHKAKNLIAVYLLHASGGDLARFCVRYGVGSLWRAVRSGQGRGAVQTWLGAWWWNLQALPRWLRERRRLQLLARRGSNGDAGSAPGAGLV